MHGLGPLSEVKDAFPPVGNTVSRQHSAIGHDGTWLKGHLGQSEPPSQDSCHPLIGWCQGCRADPAGPPWDNSTEPVQLSHLLWVGRGLC